MQILKFGGTSVENAANITTVADIIKNSCAKGKTSVVVSALGGITDTLLKTATLAAGADESYKKILFEIETRHAYYPAKQFIEPC
jgi:aspartokinase/homoserine dehydrogenase 1